MLKINKNTLSNSTGSSAFSALSKLITTTLIGVSLGACQVLDKPLDKPNNTTATSQESSLNTNLNLNGIETLEVTSAFEEEGILVGLINIETYQKSNFTLSLDNASEAELASYLPIEQGERLKITGYYKDLNRYPFEVIDITRVTKVDNPDKKACEQLANKEWRPVGMAQVPTCVTKYNDGGKTCTTSDECEGNCMVQNLLDSAFCESSDDRFGCGSVIEDFEKDGKIMCMD